MERLSDIQKRHLLVQVQRQCLTINLFDIVSLIDKYENLKIEDFAPPVRDYVKKLMGRLVFLQFLQKISINNFSICSSTQMKIMNGSD